ncbi:MSMEG_0565 family glycosyltransferase [Roseixanthobacter liquoris]|uniref:MSMEG_0565 family glycosyltransferase n=1 Tax=Roseixanthobacter liquoris TaxID=3119921 RepID=UPI003728F5D0
MTAHLLPPNRPLRIAILAHSTNPRGGVVHALELGDALARLGHQVVVHAPDAKGAGFFRPALCGTLSVPASPVGADMTDMVRIRVADYVRHFEEPAHRAFDVFHAQDGISGNALASLKERGLIRAFARTVHHVDTFADRALMALQTRAMVHADRLLVVSRTWQDNLHGKLGRRAAIVGNGVDTTRFSPLPDGREEALRARIRLGAGPVFLAVGGIEGRKNSVRLLEAFARVHARHPAAQLLIAGGASLLDHHTVQQAFDLALALLALPDGAVIRTGPLAQEDMPALYRIADTLAFPSLKEGFGLVVLEAMASGVPVATAHIAPFTEYLGTEDVAWCDPLDVASIAAALEATLDAATRARLIANGARIAARHDWASTAQAHLSTYAQLLEGAEAAPAASGPTASGPTTLEPTTSEPTALEATHA